MVKRKGKMIYAPAIVINEIEDIIREDKLFQRSEAFKEMVRYTRVGREVKRLRYLDWRRAIQGQPIPTTKKRKRR